MPAPLITVALILSLTWSMAWGKPPAKTQKGDIADPPSTEQQDDETVSVILPSASEMEANLASTLCSDLWTHSTFQTCFQPRPQPGSDTRSGKQLTLAGMLAGQSSRKPRGKNQFTKSGKLGVQFADHDSEPGPDDAPGPSDLLQPAVLGSGKMRAFNQGLNPCQQGPGKRMEIMKGNLAGQLTTPLPQYRCRYCARLCRSKGGLTLHENNCKRKPQPPQGQPVPFAGPDEELLRDEELLQSGELVQDGEPPLTLAECSRLVSACIAHPEWQDFLESGRHTTTQTTAVSTPWAGLELDTVISSDERTPFPDLTPAALNTLTQLSPTVDRLYQQLQTGNNPLADRDDLRAFIKNASQDNNELFAGGNHSLVIKWRKGPGYVLKIARSDRDNTRLNREKNLYLWLRSPDNVLLNLTTTPMRAAFSIYGKPVLALRQVDGTARDRLLSMREHHSLNERLDFALSVIFHFCQMYRRFLEKDILLADRHDDNIGFNEIPLQRRKSMGLDEAIIQVPVMLDLDPYWFGDQEFRIIRLDLPTWVPVMVGLLEEVFTPVNSAGQISESRVKVIDKIRQSASPVFSSSSALPATEEIDIETALDNCVNHWFQNINPDYSELLAEARSHIEPLLVGLNRWDSTPRTVAQWNKRLQENIAQILQWLNNWKNETEFSLLNDFTDAGIITAPSLQGATSPQDQQILTLLSMIHGKLGCQKCTRTFPSNNDFRKHWQLHQQNKLQHCEACGGDFNQIAVHERVHTKEKPYQCEQCSKTFTQISNLKKHLRTHSGDKPYKCEHCDKCFSVAVSLKQHLRTHSGDKPYKCQHCGKCFSQGGNLNKHLRIHSGDKPYKCKHCRKCFTESGHLKRHLRIHSGDTPYQCEHCDKCFSAADSLQQHLRIHYGNKPNECQHCGKCFSQSGNLKQHLRTHTGEKPYRCGQCSKCFSQSSVLKGHLRIHSGDKPYKCKRCCRSFAHSCNRNKHQKSCRTEQP